MLSGFLTELEFTDPSCIHSGECFLKQPLRYKDSSGVVWQADKFQDHTVESGTTDGASIPL